MGSIDSIETADGKTVTVGDTVWTIDAVQVTILEISEDGWADCRWVNVSRRGTYDGSRMSVTKPAWMK